MTEKEYTSTREKKTIYKQTKAADAKKIPDISKAEIKNKESPKESKKEEIKTEEKKAEVEKTPEKKESKKEEIKTEEKKGISKNKKESAYVRGVNVPISLKYSIDICKFIKRKRIQKAISDLEEVIVKKKAVPMKGEIAHRKGKIMSGKFPKVASEYFIKMLKTLDGNSNVNGLENPIISEAFANKGQMPYGRFGTVRRKRTHIIIKAEEEKKK